jgi:hypothetical protein
MLMKLYVFTKKDIDRFLIECNFTPDEERLFRLRCKEHTLEYCAEEMNVSISTAKRLSRRVNIMSEGITAALMGEMLMTIT